MKNIIHFLYMLGCANDAEHTIRHVKGTLDVSSNNNNNGKYSCKVLVSCLTECKTIYLKDATFNE